VIVIGVVSPSGSIRMGVARKVAALLSAELIQGSDARYKLSESDGHSTTPFREGVENVLIKKLMYDVDRAKDRLHSSMSDAGQEVRCLP